MNPVALRNKLASLLVKFSDRDDLVDVGTIDRPIDFDQWALFRLSTVLVVIVFSFQLCHHLASKRLLDIL